ncbi:LacI family DNA-binding transcriptional regulator [Microbacterium sp. MC2]|jgi:DNA-binding LacI/PurR family transcriptional regulator
MITRTRSAADRERTAVGLVLRRSVRTLGIEAFYNDFMAGLEDVLTAHDWALILQVVPDMSSELDAYHRWHESGRVSAVLLVDVLVPEDPRLELVDELGFTALALAHPDDAGGHAVLWTDESAVIQGAVDHLVALGHRRIGRVAGPAGFSHTERRAAAFLSAVVDAGGSPSVVSADFSREGGAAAVNELLDVDGAPTAITFDNDVMAAGAVEGLIARGVRIPENVAVLAGDDSVLCRITRPPLTAMSRDIHAFGQLSARTLLRLAEGGARTVIEADPPVLIVRDSTAGPR